MSVVPPRNGLVTDVMRAASPASLAITRMFVHVPDTAVASSGITTITCAGLVQDCSALLLLNVGVKPSAHMHPDPAWLTTALAMALQLLRLFATHFCSGVLK
jgi:hypothetical protein